MSGQIDGQLVDQFYGHEYLLTGILAGLQTAGKNLDSLTPDDLVPVDQLHIRGKMATMELAQRAGVRAGMQVLDVGGGIGGTARLLASEFNCKVTVLDVTDEFIRAGEALTERTGLSDRVTFHHGSALDMPFPDAHFDLVWTQHCTMNIADKERLFVEIWRVLRPGGRLALHEVMAGKASPVYYPVPWAREPTISEVRTPEEVRILIEATGFRVLDWVDNTALALDWFRQITKRTSTERSPVGLHLVMGEDFASMFRNQIRNLEEQRIAVIQGVAERPYTQ